MEELHEAAIGYFNNSSPTIQQNARDFFNALDTNRDGKISLAEFLRFLSEQGHSWMDQSLFTQLDHNGDGSLDFQEVLTLYYIMKTRKVFCATCRSNLFGLYFTCTTCFDHDINSFDLCLCCYKEREFRHEHDRFLDSYVLLRSRTGPCAVTEAFGTVMGEAVKPNNSQVLVPHQAQTSQQSYPQQYQMTNCNQALVPNQAQQLQQSSPQQYQMPNNSQVLVPYQAQTSQQSYPQQHQMPINIQPLVHSQSQAQTLNHQQVQAIVQYPNRPHGLVSWENAFRLLDIGIACASWAGACTIM